MRRTLPRVRELKLIVYTPRMPGTLCRTLPRVRELKLKRTLWPHVCLQRRTLPRVRELKRRGRSQPQRAANVAPFPGCVN